ncbi:ATP-NAD kinase-like domain-containing protein [Stachybotrys elegans]|uniref:ATP-NAD kinase-like domain-containing protein n=1 Tax=Stachybotrys elegans TaxID=80388 RepID=A0A8K0WQS4_9HYPO|nr:ATP-NAD kinase-like domain-containing protein [Stachybotrys elegans]
MGDQVDGTRPGDDGFSDGDDDDRNAVEIIIDPANPYRRKSSLVSSETQRLRVHPSELRTTDCMVHKFLDSQKSAMAGLGVQSPSDPQNLESANNGSLVEKLKTKGRAILDAASLEHGELGQADQQAWTKEMTKSMSEVDLANHSVADNVRSHMLTKKELSDMAWGVRELSRRLSSMRIRVRVKTIFILTKIYDQDLVPKTRELTRWLLDKDRETRYTVYVQNTLRESKKFDAPGLLDELAVSFAKGGEMDEASARAYNSKRLKYWDEDMCKQRPQTFDFIISLGGDGTVLFASWLFQRIVPPVMSFALGSLGFLTKFDFEEYASVINSAFTKGVTVSLRLRFECTVMRSRPRKGVDGASSDEDEPPMRDLVEELIGEEKEDAHTHYPDGTYEILNEVVVDRGPNPTMSSTEMFGDDEHFTSIMADGVCVSTPTGSTAYNLAAGGSLCHPENPVMLVTSICAHTLSFRPIILPDTIVLRVGVPYDARTASWASFDGRARVELKPGDYVTISASRYPFASVQMEGRRSEDWVNSISGKLGWNTRQKQKAYK